MSRAVELIACSTCGQANRDEHGLGRGERLLAQLRAVATPEHAEIALSSVVCLWSCKRSCSVHLRSEGRVGYVLGDLDDSEETARGLLAYATQYGLSSDGAVPFKQWPQAVRGHFVCRIPASPSAARAQAGADSSAKE